MHYLWPELVDFANFCPILCGNCTSSPPRHPPIRPPYALASPSSMLMQFCLFILLLHIGPICWWPTFYHSLREGREGRWGHAKRATRYYPTKRHMSGRNLVCLDLIQCHSVFETETPEFRSIFPILLKIPVLTLDFLKFHYVQNIG